jgi:hypothetical protein
MAGLLRLEILAAYHLFHGRHHEAEPLMIHCLYLREIVLDGDCFIKKEIQYRLAQIWKNVGKYTEPSAILQCVLNKPELGKSILERPLQIPLAIGDASLETRFMRKLGLPGTVDGRDYSALADTGSEHNIISHQLALEMGLAVWPARNTFNMGNSRTIHRVGCAQLEWIYRKDVLKRK